jgi:putative glutamine amidotransferase
MHLKKPIIGIVLDYREGGKDQYSANPYYAIRANHIDVINKAGAKVLLIPYDYELIEYYLELIDGLMVVGGYFDINPGRYGDSDVHKEVKLNEVRENFEFEMMTQALKNNRLPIFGICNGMQLINIVHGGNAIQHIPDDEKFLEHEQSKIVDYSDYGKSYHDVIIQKDSKLFEIIGEEKISTNSSHHQAAKNVGKGLKISGKASDGIIEAIEHQTHPFCLGVQWHPEFAGTIADNKLIQAFVEACQTYKVNDKK